MVITDSFAPRLVLIPGEPVLGTTERPVLPDDHVTDAQQAGGSAAHGAWREGGGHDQPVPVPATPGVPDADHLRMGGGVVGLHPEVVAAGDDVSRGIGKGGS